SCTPSAPQRYASRHARRTLVNATPVSPPPSSSLLKTRSTPPPPNPPGGGGGTGYREDHSFAVGRTRTSAVALNVHSPAHQPERPPLHKNVVATEAAKERARHLRRELSPPERLLWSRLRNRQLVNL